MKLTCVQTRFIYAHFLLKYITFIVTYLEYFRIQNVHPVARGLCLKKNNFSNFNRDTISIEIYKFRSGAVFVYVVVHHYLKEKTNQKQIKNLNFCDYYVSASTW